MTRAGSSKKTDTNGPNTRGKRKDEATGRPGDDYSRVFQLAVNQEEQGERYQFGDKAQRSFENSIQNYRLSIQLLQASSTSSSPADFFQSYFNLARVLIHFGTTFASAPRECVKFVKDGIDQYRQAIGMAVSNSNHSDEIDARYNLGLGLSTMAEMLSGGALEDAADPSNDYNSTATQLWKAAKEELSQAYKLQEFILADSKNLDAQLLEERGEDDMDQSIGEPSASEPSSVENAQTTMVEEVFLITPSVLIDTLVDICEVLLSLYTSEPVSTSVELDNCFEKLQLINQRIKDSNSPNFSRQFEIDNLICNANLTMIEHKLSDSAVNANPSLILELEKQLASVGQKLEELSKDSTTLSREFFSLVGLTNNLSTLCSNTCSLMITKARIINIPIPEVEIDGLSSLIVKTLEYHSGILQQLTKSKLNPIKQIKPHELPYYVCSSLNGQSELSLLLGLLNQHRRSSESSINDIDPGKKPLDLAIDAYNQTLGPYRINKCSTPNNSLKLQFSRIHQVGSTSSTDYRNEWMNYSVRLDSIKLILRSKFHHVLRLERINSIVDNPTEFQNLIKSEIVPLTRKFEITKFDLIRFLDDFVHDPVFLLSHSIESNLFEILLNVTNLGQP